MAVTPLRSTLARLRAGQPYAWQSKRAISPRRCGPATRSPSTGGSSQCERPHIRANGERRPRRRQAPSRHQNGSGHERSLAWPSDHTLTAARAIEASPRGSSARTASAQSRSCHTDRQRIRGGRLLGGGCIRKVADRPAMNRVVSGRPACASRRALASRVSAPFGRSDCRLARFGALLSANVCVRGREHLARFLERTLNLTDRGRQFLAAGSDGRKVRALAR